MSMNYVGSVTIIDRGDAPAQAVIDRNARSLAQRVADETRDELEKVLSRVENIYGSFELSQEYDQEARLEYVNDIAELEELIQDQVKKKKYQQQVTIFIVGYQDVCGQKLRLLKQVNEFFMENSKSYEEEDWFPRTPDLDLDDVAEQIEDSLQTAQDLTNRLGELNKEIVECLASYAEKKATNRGKKKLEKALQQAKDDMASLSEKLLGIQTELDEKDEKMQALFKQLEVKNLELQRFRTAAEVAKKNMQETEKLQAEISARDEKIQELRHKVNRLEIEVTSSDHSKEISQSRLVSVAEENQSHITQLTKEMEDGKSVLDDVKRELQKVHESQLLALKGTHQTELEELKKQHAEEITQLVEELEQTKQDLIAAQHRAAQLQLEKGELSETASDLTKHFDLDPSEPASVATTQQSTREGSRQPEAAETRKSKVKCKVEDLTPSKEKASRQGSKKSRSRQSKSESKPGSRASHKVEDEEFGSAAEDDFANLPKTPASEKEYAETAVQDDGGNPSTATVTTAAKGRQSKAGLAPVQESDGFEDAFDLTDDASWSSVPNAQVSGRFSQYRKLCQRRVAELEEQLQLTQSKTQRKVNNLKVQFQEHKSKWEQERALLIEQVSQAHRLQNEAEKEADAAMTQLEEFINEQEKLEQTEEEKRKDILGRADTVTMETKGAQQQEEVTPEEEPAEPAVATEVSEQDLSRLMQQTDDAKVQELNARTSGAMSAPPAVEGEKTPATQTSTKQPSAQAESLEHPFVPKSKHAHSSVEDYFDKVYLEQTQGSKNIINEQVVNFVLDNSKNMFSSPMNIETKEVKHMQDGTAEIMLPKISEPSVPVPSISAFTASRIHSDILQPATGEFNPVKVIITHVAETFTQNEQKSPHSLLRVGKLEKIHQERDSSCGPVIMEMFGKGELSDADIRQMKAVKSESLDEAHVQVTKTVSVSAVANALAEEEPVSDANRLAGDEVPKEAASPDKISSKAAKDENGQCVPVENVPNLETKEHLVPDQNLNDESAVKNKTQMEQNELTTSSVHVVSDISKQKVGKVDEASMSQESQCVSSGEQLQLAKKQKENSIHELRPKAEENNERCLVTEQALVNKEKENESLIPSGKEPMPRETENGSQHVLVRQPGRGTDNNFASIASVDFNADERFFTGTQLILINGLPFVIEKHARPTAVKDESTDALIHFEKELLSSDVSSEESQDVKETDPSLFTDISSDKESFLELDADEQNCDTSKLNTEGSDQNTGSHGWSVHSSFSQIEVDRGLSQETAAERFPEYQQVTVSNLKTLMAQASSRDQQEKIEEVVIDALQSGSHGQELTDEQKIRIKTLSALASLMVMEETEIGLVCGEVFRRLAGMTSEYLSELVAGFREEIHSRVSSQTKEHSHEESPLPENLTGIETKLEEVTDDTKEITRAQSNLEVVDAKEIQRQSSGGTKKSAASSPSEELPPLSQGSRNLSDLENPEQFKSGAVSRASQTSAGKMKGLSPNLELRRESSSISATSGLLDVPQSPSKIEGVTEDEIRASSARSRASLRNQFKQRLKETRKVVDERRTKSPGISIPTPRSLEEDKLHIDDEDEDADVPIPDDTKEEYRNQTMDIGTSPPPGKKREDTKVSISEARYTPSLAEHPVVLDFIKVYDGVVMFKNALGQILLDRDLMSASQILADLDVLQFDRSTKIQPQINSMTHNIHFMLEEIARLLNNILEYNREPAISSLAVSRDQTKVTMTTEDKTDSFPVVKPSSRGSQHTNASEAKTSSSVQELQQQYHQLQAQLQDETRRHEQQLKHNTVVMMEMQDTINDLQRELSTLGKSAKRSRSATPSLTHRHLQTPSPETSIMFTRLDSERNAKIMKKAVMDERLPSRRYKDAVVQMSEYVNLPAQRLAHLVRKYIHHCRMKAIEEKVKKSESLSENVFDVLDKMEALQNERARKWAEHMDEMGTERVKLASSLMETLDSIEQESGIFLIKPMYSFRGRDMKQKYVGKLSRPVRPHRASPTREGGSSIAPAPTPSSHIRPIRDDRAFHKVKSSAGTLRSEPLQPLQGDTNGVSGASMSWVGQSPRQTWNFSSSHAKSASSDVSNNYNTPRILELDINRMLIGQNNISSQLPQPISEDRLVNAAQNNLRSYVTVHRPVATPTQVTSSSRPKSESATPRDSGPPTTPLQPTSAGKKRVRVAETDLEIPTSLQHPRTPPLPPIKAGEPPASPSGSSPRQSPQSQEETTEPRVKIFTRESSQLTGTSASEDE